MTKELAVRRLLIDLEAPMARHWCGGDPFRTAWFNALSMSFPTGEQFFIDSVRTGVAALPEAAQENFRIEVQAFIAQEATHRRIHQRFNRHLEARGLENKWGPSAQSRMVLFKGRDPLHALALSAGSEHLTAIIAEWLLAHPAQLGPCETRLETLWLWHSSEELEHRCTVFDLYRALGGSEAWRRMWFRRVTLIFLKEVFRQTWVNLARDGSLWRWATWRSGARFLFGKEGFLRANFAPWRSYLAAGFHPQQEDESRALDWLASHSDVFSVVR